MFVAQSGGRTSLHAAQQGPNSYTCLSVFAFLVNPIFGKLNCALRILFEHACMMIVLEKLHLRNFAGNM